jgi:hypothetical protein
MIDEIQYQITKKGCGTMFHNTTNVNEIEERKLRIEGEQEKRKEKGKGKEG